ncbi:sel1 repeat family protein [Helicobacter sp. MIT 14-3879]|uniref:sel1 repeat family protein n=1 Tax=Helicobacter sp. MIT 14-3879 TaxID=2040649 RepID=UPI000E1F423A|nr:sel1 repeat family protein [Helicobacter sp. MIT 14-3879]RDU65565.1 hypothetical protein CQA44_00880 [Helicobacter sp. MIT 14-3879]
MEIYQFVIPLIHISNLNVECRDSKKKESCEDLFYTNKYLCEIEVEDYNCHLTGYAYFTGGFDFGVIKNDYLALSYFKKLCDKGHEVSDTCFYTGLIYGNFKDYQNAIFYLKNACNAGMTAACELLPPTINKSN